MDILEMLGVALGFGVLSGVNLYLTVFISGLAVRFGWLDIFQQYTELSMLADPWVLGISGVMFVMEAFADKIPWVDSTWDVIHTGIRPIGGVILSIAALGELDPTLALIAGLLTGGTSLISHTAKASTRAAINLSPEPITNIIASTTEDACVLGGLGLMAFAPMTSFFVFIAVTIVALVIIWKSYGFLKQVWSKIIAKLRGKRVPLGHG